MSFKINSIFIICIVLAAAFQLSFSSTTNRPSQTGCSCYQNGTVFPPSTTIIELDGSIVLEVHLIKIVNAVVGELKNVVQVALSLVDSVLKLLSNVLSVVANLLFIISQLTSCITILGSNSIGERITSVVTPIASNHNQVTACCPYSFGSIDGDVQIISTVAVTSVLLTVNFVVQLLFVQLYLTVWATLNALLGLINAVLTILTVLVGSLKSLQTILVGCDFDNLQVELFDNLNTLFIGSCPK